VTVDLGGCEKTDTFNLTVTPAPTVDLDESLVVCTGEDFTLAPTIMAGSQVWQDGSVGATFSSDQPGIYWVEGTNGSCTLRDSIVVTYLDAGAVNLGADTTVCEANSLLLDPGNLSVDSYTWQDGSTEQTFTATASGAYHVTIEVSGCTASDTINVVFADNDGLMVAGDYLECQGETFRLTAPVAADSYTWSNGQTGPDFSTAAPGTYELDVEVGPCSLSETFTVGFLAPPVLELGPDTTVCDGEVVAFDAGQTGTWQDGSQQQVFPASAAGRYRVTVSNEACTVVDSVDLAVLALPEFDLGDDQSACQGEVLSVTVPGGLGEVLWNDDSTVLVREFTTSGAFTVAITDANGCVGRDTVALTFAAPPLLELGPDTTVCDNLPFSLQPVVGEGVLTWPDGSTDQTYPILSPGLVVATLNNDGCVSSDSVVVAFRECVFFEVYLPTGFSPNFDGVNDDFQPLFDERLEIVSYELVVYGRWGELLFSTDDPSVGWDGTADGKELDPGVFTFSVAVGYVDDRGPGEKVFGGQVTLLR